MKMIGSQITAQSWIFWKAVPPADGVDTATCSMRNDGPPAPSLKVFVLASTTHGLAGLLPGACSSSRKFATAFEQERRSVSSTSTR